MMLESGYFFILLSTIVKFFIPAVIKRESTLVRFNIVVVVSFSENNSIFLSNTLACRREDFGIILRVAFATGVGKWTDCWYCC